MINFFKHLAIIELTYLWMQKNKLHGLGWGFRGIFWWRWLKVKQGKKSRSIFLGKLGPKGVIRLPVINLTGMFSRFEVIYDSNTTFTALVNYRTSLQYLHKTLPGMSTLTIESPTQIVALSPSLDLMVKLSSNHMNLNLFLIFLLFSRRPILSATSWWNYGCSRYLDLDLARTRNLKIQTW